MVKRCSWAGPDKIYINYHDKEWGRPVYDDQKLFEFLVLEGMQAGLSWITILKKRENYRKLFAGLVPEVIANFSDEKLNQLLTNPGIIRNRLKVYAIRQNAQAFLAVQREFGSFSKYIWQFVGGKPIKNNWQASSDNPARTEISDSMAKDLKKRGFKFVGSTICYAFMQAVGMVNDHAIDCICYLNAP